MQRDARALSEHTPGVEPMSDRRKWQRAEPADSREAAYCGKGVTDASVTCIYVLYGLFGACTNCTYCKYHYVDDSINVCSAVFSEVIVISPVTKRQESSKPA